VYRPEQRERPQLKEVLTETTQNEGDSEDNTDSGPVASTKRRKLRKGSEKHGQGHMIVLAGEDKRTKFDPTDSQIVKCGIQMRQ
jgi:hypothetical protein